MGEEAALLDHVADARERLLPRPRSHRDAGHPHGAAVGRDQPDDDPEQGALAAPARADDGERRARGNGESGDVEGQEVAEALLDALQQDGIGWTGIRHRGIVRLGQVRG